MSDELSKYCRSGASLTHKAHLDLTAEIIPQTRCVFTLLIKHTNDILFTITLDERQIVALGRMNVESHDVVAVRNQQIGYRTADARGRTRE